MYFNNYKFLPGEISVGPIIFVAAKTFVGFHVVSSDLYEFYEEISLNKLF